MKCQRFCIKLASTNYLNYLKLIDKFSDLKTDFESFKNTKAEQEKILDEKLEKAREDLNESRFVFMMFFCYKKLLCYF